MKIQKLTLSAVFVGIVITSSVVYATTTNNQKTYTGIRSFIINDHHVQKRHSRRGEILRHRREATRQAEM